MHAIGAHHSSVERLKFRPVFRGNVFQDSVDILVFEILPRADAKDRHVRHIDATGFQRLQLRAGLRRISRIIRGACGKHDRPAFQIRVGEPLGCLRDRLAAGVFVRRGDILAVDDRKNLRRRRARRRVHGAGHAADATSQTVADRARRRGGLRAGRRSAAARKRARRRVIFLDPHVRELLRGRVRVAAVGADRFWIYELPGGRVRVREQFGRAGALLMREIQFRIRRRAAQSFGQRRLVVGGVMRSAVDRRGGVFLVDAILLCRAVRKLHQAARETVVGCRVSLAFDIGGLSEIVR